MKFNLAEVVTLIVWASLCPSHSLVRIACSRSDLTRASGTALRRQPDLRVSEYISPIDAKAVKDGSLVEYISGKGAKRLAIVNSRLGLQLEVLNEAKRTIKVPITRVTHHIKGSFAFGDLLRLNEILSDLKPNQVERLWEASYGQKDAAVCSLPYISKQIFGSSDAVRTFATMKLMASFGGVFFGQEVAEDDVTVALEGTDSASAVEVAKELSFFPLAPNIVQQNLRSRAALKEFKLRFVKHRASRTDWSRGSPYQPMVIGDMPDRVQDVVGEYAEGLKHLVMKNHPWVLSGMSRRRYEAKTALKGKEFMDYLELGSSSKSARSLLELIGIWPDHSNVEKYVMGLRDKFPVEVLDEAQYLLDNAETIPDPDERLRRDLRHLGCYAIDKEGAAEVDDAVSIERLDDGREKLWIHIADVSRWIRPGSQLSLEAERRMVSVYMPDERISMFPYALSTELLSLGAGVDSYALSCGVTLDEYGDVTSFEVCPSRVRVTRRISYTELDDLLAKEESNGRILESLMAEGNNSTAATNPSPSQSLDPYMKADLSRLSYWATVRHKFRNKKHALDQYLRHKTELSLSVRMDQKTFKQVVSGFTSWSNATSMSLVSEYMILMCETVGGMCKGIQAPVLFKIQSPNPALAVEELDLQEGETPFLRSARIMRHLRAAVDSATPGPHCTSGSVAYVQCTSPIRRYHDLYNHYRLKAAMHGASMGEEWAGNNRAEEEAGISRLDGMATSEERLQTLNAVRLVSRNRDQYWFQIYVNKLVLTEPRIAFACLVVGPQREGPRIQVGVAEEAMAVVPDKERDGNLLSYKDEDGVTTTGVMYDAIVLQLGSFFRYSLYRPANMPLVKGELINCHLRKRFTDPLSFLLVPVDFHGDLPPLLAEEMKRPKFKNKLIEEGDEEVEGEHDDHSEADGDSDSTIIISDGDADGESNDIEGDVVISDGDSESDSSVSDT